MNKNYILVLLTIILITGFNLTQAQSNPTINPISFDMHGNEIMNVSNFEINHYEEYRYSESDTSGELDRTGPYYVMKMDYRTGLYFDNELREETKFLGLLLNIDSNVDVSGSIRLNSSVSSPPMQMLYINWFNSSLGEDNVIYYLDQGYDFVLTVNEFDHWDYTEIPNETVVHQTAQFESLEPLNRLNVSFLLVYGWNNGTYIEQDIENSYEYEVNYTEISITEIRNEEVPISFWILPTSLVFCLIIRREKN